MDEEKKVKDLAEARAKKEKKDNPKPKKIRVYQALADVINRDQFVTLPRFDVRFHLFEPDPGSRLILREGENNEVTLVAEETAVNELLGYLRTKVFKDEEFQLTHREAKEAIAYWRGSSLTIPRPRAVGWLGDDERAFRRLPWAQGLANCPTWGVLLERMSNKFAFCLWLGSLFYPESSLHQYVWVHGEGGDGKGAINRFLARVFGTAYCSKQPPAPSDRFWTYGLIGKRIVVFPDCNSQTFVASGLFKSLTGGDPVDVERKGSMSFTYQPECKFLFLSNTRPTISSEKSDVRRLIYCEFEKRAVDDADDPEFESRLWTEGGGFLSTCMDAYRQGYPNHGQIAVDNLQLNEHLETLEERFEAVLDDHFVVDLNTPSEWVMGIRIQQLCGRQFSSGRDYQAFLSWLGRKKGIIKQTVRFGSKTPKVYRGLVSKIDRASRCTGGRTPSSTSIHRRDVDA